MRKALATLAKQETTWRDGLSSESLGKGISGFRGGRATAIQGERIGCGNGPEESFLRGVGQKTAVPPAAGENPIHLTSFM
jgi:hypothetical protein